MATIRTCLLAATWLLVLPARPPGQKLKNICCVGAGLADSGAARALVQRAADGGRRGGQRCARAAAALGILRGNKRRGVCWPGAFCLLIACWPLLPGLYHAGTMCTAFCTASDLASKHVRVAGVQHAGRGGVYHPPGSLIVRVCVPAHPGRMMLRLACQCALCDCCCWCRRVRR